MAGKNGFAETSVCFVQRPKAVAFGNGHEPVAQWSGGPVVWWSSGPVAQGQPLPVLLEAAVTAAFTSGKKDEGRKFVIKQGGS